MCFKYFGDYLRFEVAVTNRWRFLQDEKAEEFLAAVAATAVTRIEPVKKSTVLWRAQLGMLPIIADGDAYSFEPYPTERMKPRRDSASEGRANPLGIPVLYCATSPETAMAEVRPNLASSLSLAKLETRKDLVVVDCSKNISDRSIFDIVERGEIPPPTEIEPIVWGAIDEAFRRPVDRSDNEAVYAHTQVIAELFKREGYDGIKYRSGYGRTGYNVALFDLDCAEVVDVTLRRVKSIQVTFD